MDAIKHLRIHFSLLLMPVFLFALSQTTEAKTDNILLIFIILHVLVYPASNAFNSYHDRDTESIGGLKNPPPINELVRHLANTLDILAILLSAIFLSTAFVVLLFGYILMSRLYSHRKVRIKKYALPAFLTVFIFQGGYTFLLVFVGLEQPLSPVIFYALLASSLQIGAVYPLTQIYQHKADKKDGVNSMSAILGYRGTFLFSGLMFGLAIGAYFIYFNTLGLTNQFYILLLFQIPVVFFFNWWAIKVFKNETAANFTNTMRLSILSAICMNLCFAILFYLNIL